MAKSDQADTGIIRRKTFTAQVADELRKRILTGELKAGEQLRQDRLADLMGVSRIPVREALHQLHSEGLVTLVPQMGAVVSPISLEEFVELYQLRSHLETWLLRHAIPNMTDEDFAAIEQANIQYSAMAKHDDAGVAANWEFHKALYRASGKPATISILEKIYTQIQRYSRMIISLTDADGKFQTEHSRIVQYCRDKNITGAVDALEAHINGDGQMLEAQLKSLRAAPATP